MPITVKNISLWRKEVENQAGTLAHTLEPVTKAGEDSGKFVLNFEEPAQPIGPIPLVKNGRVKAPQSIRYTTHERLMKAKNLDELFGTKAKGASG